MYSEGKIWIGNSVDDKRVCINPKMANRHGMIAGATGTGKTVTLKVMAESFSAAGVPVFMADVKGDLSGMCKNGQINENLAERIQRFSLSQAGYRATSYPATFWDVYGEKGMPLRTTISEMGPLLLSRILDLNPTQSDLLTVVFKIADDEELLLVDTKDLKAMLNYVGENASAYSADYGNIAKVSINAIIRAVVALESEGADQFFGEPALAINDWFLQASGSDKAMIQILDCQKLINHPTMYATFMLWMMSELFETLPEAGDLDKPKMVFFFDEAHMLFNNASKVLLDKIEQVVKLIRSKGVGIYFITQSPKDIPDGVLAQLGNKVQHALHAYTPTEQKAAKAAAGSFRENPAFNTYDVLLELGIGEALVSVLDEKGAPTVVEKTMILPPQSFMGAISEEERESQIKASPLYSRYNDYFDRDSAYEFLTRQKQLADEEAAAAKQAAADAKAEEKAAKEAEKAALKAQKEKEKARKNNPANQVAKSVARTTGGTIGRELGKSVGKSVGGSFGKTVGGNIGSTLGRSILGTFFK